MTPLESCVCSTQGLELDRVRRRVRIDGKLLPKSLSWRQFELLEFLATRAGKVCLREETSRAVYGERYIRHRDDARLDALIERTRLHIGDDQRHPRFIETVRGIGHRLNNYTDAELTP
jgi:DNA-binding response OmpR family regulator